jgi:hypothetical protein
MARGLPFQKANHAFTFVYMLVVVEQVNATLHRAFE